MQIFPVKSRMWSNFVDARGKRYPHNQFRFALPYVMEKEFVAVLYS